MAVSVDDVPVGVVTANMFRADVQEAGFGDGSYGFALRLDTSGVNVEGKQIRVRVEDENYELPNSPWTIPTPFGSSYSSLPWSSRPFSPNSTAKWKTQTVEIWRSAITMKDSLSWRVCSMTRYWIQRGQR